MLSIFGRIWLLVFLSSSPTRAELLLQAEVEIEDSEKERDEKEDRVEDDETITLGESEESIAKRFYDVPKESPYYLSRDPQRPRSTFWAPLFSFMLPGLDQLMEGQEAYGFAYLGTAIGGSFYSARTLKHYRKSFADPKDMKRDAFESNPNIYEKKIRLGEQIQMSAGSLSAYHAYRSAVTTYADGRYDFLGKSETPGELLIAPFRFDLMLKPTTFIPVGIAAALHYIAMESVGSEEGWEDYRRVPLGRDGAFYAGAYSYLAGVNEEALFRGWLLPEMYVALGSTFWAKMGNALLFGAAHLGNISRPLPQLFFGYYLSGITIENNWQITEPIFIHTWWNVFAFLTAHQLHKKEKPGAQFIWAPITLPLLNRSF